MYAGPRTRNPLPTVLQSEDPNKDIEQREFAAAQAENKAQAEYESVEAVGDSEFAWPASPEETAWSQMEDETRSLERGWL